MEVSERKGSRKGKSFVRIILVILTLSVMVFIFQMSAMNADDSSKLSTSLGYTVGKWLVNNFDELSLEKQEEFAKSIEHYLRKFAHFSEYAALGFLFLMDFAEFTGLKRMKRFLAALLSGFLYAVTDELHQLLVSGRSGQISDVVLDTGGVMTGCVIASLCILFFVRFLFDLKKH